MIQSAAPRAVYARHATHRACPRARLSPAPPRHWAPACQSWRIRWPPPAAAAPCHCAFFVGRPPSRAGADTRRRRCSARLGRPVRGSPVPLLCQAAYRGAIDARCLQDLKRARTVRTHARMPSTTRFFLLSLSLSLSHTTGGGGGTPPQPPPPPEAARRNPLNPLSLSRSLPGRSPALSSSPTLATFWNSASFPLVTPGRHRHRLRRERRARRARARTATRPAARLSASTAGPSVP